MWLKCLHHRKKSMMPTTRPRFIVNTESKIYHNRYGLTENCNTDQIKSKYRTDTIPVGYSPCQWCIGDKVDA